VWVDTVEGRVIGAGAMRLPKRSRETDHSTRAEAEMVVQEAHALIRLIEENTIIPTERMVIEMTTDSQGTVETIKSHVIRSKSAAQSLSRACRR
jgi:hypothetical protein